MPGLRNVRRRIVDRLINAEPVFWASLAARARAFGPRARPSLQRSNVALQSVAQWKDALVEVDRLGLPPHPDRPKNWDALAALDLVLRSTGREAAVLDAGAETYSPLLSWLYWYGYRDLHGINLVFDGDFTRGPIRYVAGDMTRAPYPEDRFDVVASLSVIEHGVDVPAFLKEAGRLLRPNGLLILSCDYHPEATDTREHTAYGSPVHVFQRDEIERLMAIASEIGLEPTSPVALDCRERPVRWDRLGISFTFLLLSLRKAA